MRRVLAILQSIIECPAIGDVKPSTAPNGPGHAVHSAYRIPRAMGQTATPAAGLPARPEVHLHFHGASAEEVAVILARVNHEGRERVY
jgi:hypothetical protein